MRGWQPSKVGIAYLKASREVPWNLDKTIEPQAICDERGSKDRRRYWMLGQKQEYQSHSAVEM